MLIFHPQGSMGMAQSAVCLFISTWLLDPFGAGVIYAVVRAAHTGQVFQELEENRLLIYGGKFFF